MGCFRFAGSEVKPTVSRKSKIPGGQRRGTDFMITWRPHVGKEREAESKGRKTETS